MLFTREELVEMGLLSPELQSNPRQLLEKIGEFDSELPSNSRQLDQVAGSGLPGCRVVAGSEQQVATDLTPLFIYIYFSRLLGCKNILEVEGEINEKYRMKTIVSPYNPATLPNLEIFVSLWETYCCADYAVVATSEGTLQPELVDLAVQATKTTHIYGLIQQDWAFYKRFGHLPGDAWDGIITDDGLTLDTFDIKLSRVCTDDEILDAAQIERQQVKAGKTMLSLMYGHNVKDYVWFEGHDGQWHCYTTKGMQ